MIKRSILVLWIVGLTASLPAFAQPMEDVVYLKDGGVVRGTIIEQVEGESLRIETAGGNVFAYSMEEIAEITSEPVAEAEAVAGGFEIGTLFGLTHQSRGDRGFTLIGLPDAGFDAGSPALYVEWFPSDKLSIGPEFNVAFTSGGSSDAWARVAGRFAYFPRGVAMSGPYVVGLAALKGDTTGTNNSFGAGGGGGYRWRVGPAFALRVEARYRRWFDSQDYYYYSTTDQNEFSLVIGLGTVLGGK